MNSLLQENRKFGFVEVSTAPPRFSARLCEIRAAIVDGRKIPAPSAEYRAYAERASAIAKRIFPQQHVNRRAETTTQNSVDKLRASLENLSIF
jgi:hypothetical protein